MCRGAVWLYLGNMSTRPVLFWLVYATGYILRHSFTNVQVRSLISQFGSSITLVIPIQSWWLGVWAAQYETAAPEQVHVPL